MDTEKLTACHSYPYGTDHNVDERVPEGKTAFDFDTVIANCIIKYGCYSILTFLLVVSPISMITIGIIYFHDCPDHHYIPIYLVVAGSMTIFSGITTIVTRRKVKKASSEQVAEPNRCWLAVTNLINCVTLTWYIAGFVWVYSAVPLPEGHRCHRVVYFFSFWLSNTLLSMFILFLIASILSLLLGIERTD